MHFIIFLIVISQEENMDFENEIFDTIIDFSSVHKAVLKDGGNISQYKQELSVNVQNYTNTQAQILTCG